MNLSCFASWFEF